MNRAAQNALLKTLEEPPAGRVLILVTSKPFLLLPTVRSRCRRIRFGPIRNDIMVEILEQQGLDREKSANRRYVRWQRGPCFGNERISFPGSQAAND